MSMSATVDKEGPPIGVLHEVRARFASPETMQEAVDRLEISGFDRADLSLPEANPPIERATPDWGARPADTEQDARQARTLHVSGAAAVGALAASAVVIASGGAVAWAVVAAIVTAAIVGGIVHALSSAANQAEQGDRERKAARGALILSVHTPTAEKRVDAEAILRAAGGTQLEEQ
jgi:hypothetical protein